MRDEDRTELERRIALIETDPDQGVLPPLPRIDLIVSVVVLIVGSALLLWWSL